MRNKRLTRLSLNFSLWLLLKCFSISLFGQTPVLQRTITLQATEESVESVLKKIALQAAISFSYNPQKIDIRRLVTLSIKNRPLAEALYLLFQESVSYKLKGKYVLLFENKSQEEESKFLVRGYVIDSTSGKKIPEVSIYEKRSLASAVSNGYGYYEIRLPAEKRKVILSLSKQNYWQKEFDLNSNRDQFVNIGLTPLPLDSIPENNNNDFSIQRVSDSAVLKTIPDSSNKKKPTVKDKIRKTTAMALSPLLEGLLSKKQKTHDKNVDNQLSRQFQISFLPAVSTNRFMGGNTLTKVSLNILAGYNLGVEGLEIGGLFNFVRDSVKYVQLAGLGNTVGGQVSGFQSAGIYNLVKGNANGIQAGGFFNFNQGEMKGFQIAGAINFQKGKVQGVQSAGLFNLNLGTSEGIQMAGLFNYNRLETNYLQLAGLFNVSGKELEGVQIAGLLNYARKVKKGVQIGFINIADSAQKVVPVGLLSIVRKGNGYQRLELFTDELLHTGLSFRTGVPQFYNILMAGTRPFAPKENWFFGYGLGTTLFNGKKWIVDFNLAGMQITEGGELFRNWVFKSFIGVEFKFSRRWSIALSPGINYWWGQESDTFDRFYPYKTPLQLFNENETRRQLWAGIQFGIRWR